MRRGKRKTSAIDREMNEALKLARTPMEAMAIRREAAQRRTHALVGRVTEQSIVLPTLPLLDGNWTVSMHVNTEAFEGFQRALQGFQENFNRVFLPFASQETEQWKAAKQRAHEFLLAHLSDEQKHTMVKRGYFITHNKTSGRAWRIRTTTTAFNVDALDKNGKVINTFCGLPGGERLPEDDIFLAQKLLLETDEVEFLLKANRKNVAYGDINLAAL